MAMRAHLASAMDVFRVDPQLERHQKHLQHRWKAYEDAKARVAKDFGGMDAFSRGYDTYGFTRERGCVVYREWCPSAKAVQLIGDFNGWNASWCERKEFGVWELKLADGADGRRAIPHASRVKVRVQKPDGAWVDRIPAWIAWATVEQGKMGAKYDGVMWDPEEDQKYRWQNARPKKPQAPRIYESHVGMSSQDPKVATYREYAEQVLPRVKALGYNTIQLMAIMEHAYYASFGYHVTNPFAVSSRSGTPEDLKYLVDTAHGMGISVLMDVVHSHASKNADDGIAGFDFGQKEEDNYFLLGEKGYHSLWDSKLYNFGNWEVRRYLLSNLRWWMEEYQFDGFRFDGITSMLYHHHGINVGFSGNYEEYFSMNTDVDACVYLMLANDMLHSLYPDCTTIAEDVSGMPTLCRPVHEGGIGFDYRLAMAIPDKWIQLLKHVRDEDWSMLDIVTTLCNRRYTEKCVAYAESHDQALVGDKTMAMWLMDAKMYTGMSVFNEASPIVDRGMSLHKMIRMVTMAFGGDGYLTFMGNEFGHPEWIDFPREGNGWSHQHARRQYNLVDDKNLRYKFLNDWDRAMQELDKRYGFLSSSHQIISSHDETDKVIIGERGELLFVFNFHVSNSYMSYKVGVGEPGKWRLVLDSDAWDFGGHGRIPHDCDYFTQPEGVPGKPETNFNDRPCSLTLPLASRSVQVYARVPEGPGSLEAVAGPEP